MQTTIQSTPRTMDFWKKQMDMPDKDEAYIKDFSKEKINEIFYETIEYFKKEIVEEKEDRHESQDVRLKIL